MPPKGKLKGVVGPVQYSLPPPPAAPQPRPLPPPDRDVKLLATPREAVLVAGDRVTIISRSGQESPERTLTVDSAVRAAAACCGSSSAVLLCTATKLLMLGGFEEGRHEKKEAAALDWPADEFGGAAGLGGGLDYVMTSIGAGSSHAVGVALRLGAGSTLVVGIGAVDQYQLSRAALNLAKGRDCVPRLVPLHCFDGEGVTEVWAGGNLTLANGRRGLLCLGTLGPHSVFPEPTVVIPRAESHVHALQTDDSTMSVAIGESKVYVLTQRREILLLEEEPPRDLLTPRHGSDEVCRWHVTNVTAELFPRQRRVRHSIHTMRLDEALTAEVPPHRRFDQIHAGRQHWVALDRQTRVVYGWGGNAFGQLGGRCGPTENGSPSSRELFATSAIELHWADAPALRAPLDAPSLLNRSLSLTAKASEAPRAVSLGCTSWATLIALEDGSVHVLGEY